MAPPHGGNIYLPFVDLIKLEKVDERTYRSIALPFSPGGAIGKGRTYGGHVFMQAAWAACQTVGPGFLLHNVTGSFILPGLVEIPFIYKVHIIRDGRSFATRIVNVTQAEGKGICFTSTCSFKLPENSPLDVQEKVDIWDQYAPALQGKQPLDFEECPGVDAPWYNKRRKETGLNDALPGLQMLKVNMDPYNEPRHPLDRRQLIFYRSTGDIPHDQPNMHLCAHLYASDRNSLYNVANYLGIGDTNTQMGSLSHTVIFHAGMDHMSLGRSATTDARLHDKDGQWFCREDSSNRVTDGRGLFQSKLWSADGRHIASILQDGMIRVTRKPKATPQELQATRDLEKTWKPRGRL